MLEARLSNGMIVYIKISIKRFLDGEDRGMWYDAEIRDSGTKLKISSKQVVSIREIE
jgi:hypothetical protein